MNIKFYNDLTTPLTEVLLRLYAEGSEGDSDSSWNLYGKLLVQATHQDLCYLIYRTPCHQLRVRLTWIFFHDHQLPEEVLIKVKESREIVKKLYPTLYDQYKDK